MKKILLVAMIIVVVCGLYVVRTINTLIPMDENVNAAWSQVLNQYQRRTDLIPSLVNTVKGYAEHEQETLTQVIEARSKATQTTVSPEMLSDPKAVQSFMDNQGALTSALSRLMVVVEKYPDLKANQNFLALQSELSGTENRIAVARQDYINTIKEFNSRVRRIPTRWVVETFSDMEPKASFTIEESAQKAPLVQF